MHAWSPPILDGSDDHGRGGHDNMGRSRKVGQLVVTDAEIDSLLLGLNELEKVVVNDGGGGGGLLLLDEDHDSNILPFSNNNNNDQYYSNIINTSTTSSSNSQLQQQQNMIQSVLDDFDEFETASSLVPPPTPYCTTDHVTTASVLPPHHLQQHHMAATTSDQSLAMIEEMSASATATTTVRDHIMIGATTSNYNFDDMGFISTSIGNGMIIGGTSSEQPYMINTCDAASHDHYYWIHHNNNNAANYSTNHVFEPPNYSPSLIRYFICTTTAAAAATTHHQNHVMCRRNNKRKYRGVCETEEETSRRLHHAKIKNREAAANAYLKRQAYEAKLQTQVLKLRKKNQLLQNKITFLQGLKRVAMHPQPLRRTISEPISCQSSIQVKCTSEADAAE